MSLLKFLGTALLATAFGGVSAKADTVWTFYDESGGMGGDVVAEPSTSTHFVFYNEQTKVRFYVEAAGGLEPGIAHNGYYVMYDQSRTPCPTGAAADHFGNSLPMWGYLQYMSDPNSEDFQVNVGICDGPLEQVLTARW